MLFVAGAGRSGTSTLAGIMQQLGMHVPQPEVVADATNPKGFGEPQWLVDFHDELLERANVQVGDARPAAWFETGRLSNREGVRTRAATWLAGHFEEADELVVKDPRLAWFLGLWRHAASRSGATPCFATMLRPPAEVIGSKQKYYGGRLGQAHVAASWVNMMLHTERATRDGQRVFVRYHDLLEDWTSSVMHAGEALGLRAVIEARPEDIRKVHNFIDPSLRRVRLTLEEVEMPDRLRAMVGETWDVMSGLAEPDGDTEEARGRLDGLREEYTEYYLEAEAVVKSSIIAARHAGAARARKELAEQEPSAAPGGSRPAGRPSLTVRAAELVDRVPHEARVKVPAPVRRGVRKVLHRPDDGSGRTTR